MSKNPQTQSVVEIYGLPAWYARAFGWLVVSVLGLVALGGSVRIMNAGLACPDWPLCFGDVIPDYHPQVYFEFTHRVVAGIIGLVTVSLQVVMFRSRAPRALKWLAAGTLLLLAAQIVMGGLTVLLQLHSKVVAAHLGMGTGFFALLLWQYLSVRDQRTLFKQSSESETLPGQSSNRPMSTHSTRGAPSENLDSAVISAPLRYWSVFLTASVYGQILLGGLVASHFASLVCTDFPTCHGQWFPTFSGIIGLHVIHRLGAYTIFALLLLNLIILWRKSQLRNGALWMFALVCSQITIGVANVIFHTPPIIAVAHLTVATAILGFTLLQNRMAWIDAR